MHLHCHHFFRRQLATLTSLSSEEVLTVELDDSALLRTGLGIWRIEEAILQKNPLCSSAHMSAGVQQMCSTGMAGQVVLPSRVCHRVL